MNGRDGDCGNISDTKCGTDWDANRRNFAGDTVYERASFSFGRVARNVFIIEVVAVFGGFFFAGFFILLMTGGVYFSVGASNAIGNSFFKILGVCVGVAGGGNRNFNTLYNHTAKDIAHGLDVPVVFEFEFNGTQKDVENFKKVVNEIGIK